MAIFFLCFFILSFFYVCLCVQGLPWCLSSKEFTCQCRRCGFDSWVVKILWRRKWQPAPVFLPLSWNSLGKNTGVACHALQRIFVPQARRTHISCGFFITCLGLPCGSTGKESTCNVGDLGLIPGLGSSPGEGNGYPLQYSGLENSMDCIVHGVAKSQTLLSDFHLLTSTTGATWEALQSQTRFTN